MTVAAITRAVKDLAIEIGFDLVGVAHAGKPQRGSHYRQWLDSGYAGTMAYLHRNVEIREDPARLLPGCRSIVCAAVSYGREDGKKAKPGTAPGGRVSQYARGRDYHRVLRSKLERLATDVRTRLDVEFDHRVCVDTAPVLERDLAASAGLGWIGKSTMLLHERLGTYLFLGELLTTLELEPDSPVADHCGSCTACLDACPTQAFPKPYQLDASRCISYLTIEHRGEISGEFHAAMGDWVFGCDVCQQVCPFNNHAPPGTNAELIDDRLPEYLDLTKLLVLRSGEYRRLTRDSATARATRKMWQRNAVIALRNARPAP